MGKNTRLLLFFCALCFRYSLTDRVAVAAAQRTTAPAPAQVHVGVILNMQKNSTMGRMCNTSLAMAVEDFYTENSNFRTRLVLHPRDSNNDVVGAASAGM